MARFGRQLFIKLLYVFLDVLVLSFSIYMTCLIRRETLPFPVTFQNIFFDPINSYRFLFLFWILITIILNNSNDLYETKREMLESFEIWQIIKSVLTSSLIVIVAIYIVRVEDFPRSVLILMVVLITLFFSIWRICKRLFVQYIVSRGYNNFNALIVGAGRVGMSLAKELEHHSVLGIKVVGYLDDFKTEMPDVKGPKILGKIEDFEKIVRREFINKVFITVHHDSRVFFNLLEQSKELGIAVRVVPQGFELMPTDFVKYNIGIIPVIEYGNVENLRKQAGKRVFDFLAATFLTVLFSPVFLILGILIKLDSPGGVFYLSKRYGRGGRIFHMYKFRSMVSDAEKIQDRFLDQNEADGPIFKIKKDPRITRVGQFLRKYSLDELPQLLNVVRGDMSLVGPRPLPISQIEREDLRQLQRLEVRPGITGLWQIRGRSDLTFSRLVKWDVWYINNWSFWLDINILFQTIPVVIKGKGAY